MNFHSKIDVHLFVISEVFLLVISQSSVRLEGEKCTCGRWRKILKCNWVGLPSRVKNPPAHAEDMGSIPGRQDPRRRKWQPTPIFLPGKSHGQRSLADHSPWDCKRAGQNLATTQQQKWNNFFFRSGGKGELPFPSSCKWPGPLPASQAQCPFWEPPVRTDLKFLVRVTSRS